MIGAKRLALAIAVLLLAAAAAWSQPAADAQSDTKANTPQPDPATDTGDTAAEPTPSQAGRAPGDYRASEQISEDLSVSFPVDI